MSYTDKMHPALIVRALTRKYRCSREELLDIFEVVEKAVKRPINRDKYQKRWINKQLQMATLQVEESLG